MAVKLSANSYPENELEIMKKCDNQFLVKLLDSFHVEIPFYGSLYGIVMDFCEVRKNMQWSYIIFHVPLLWYGGFIYSIQIT